MSEYSTHNDNILYATSDLSFSNVESTLKKKNVNMLYLINMKRREDRLLFMKFKLSKMGISNYSVIEAVDGSTPDNTIMFTKYREIHSDYMKNTGFKRKINEFPVNSRGALGLLLTYKKIIDSIPLDNSSNIMILEDDIMFHKNFALLLDTQIHRLLVSDIVYLGANQTRFTDDMLDKIKDGYYNLSDLNYYWTYGTYSLILTPKLINLLRISLSDMLSPYLLNIDLMIWNIVTTNKMTGIVLYPNLIIPQVYESDNMSSRDIISISKERKWNLEYYDYVNTTSLFQDCYNRAVNTNVSFINNALSLRSPNIVHSNEMSNLELSRVIENKNRCFVFIIPSYNNALYYKKNLDSIFAQNYPYYRIIYTDDASTDGTYEFVKKYIIDNGFEQKSTILKNNINMMQTYNRYVMYNMCQDDEICCMLDGDDWLVDSDVLTKLNNLYNANDLLISYGQFYYYFDDKIQNLSGIQKYNIDTIMSLTYRKHPLFVSQHLRTCCAKLLKTIPLDYLKFNGDFLKCCSDKAEMLWVLERSEGRHMNTGFPTLIYNKTSSMLHDNSYYNIDKDSNWKQYRIDVEKYLESYPSPNELV